MHGGESLEMKIFKIKEHKITLSYLRIKLFILKTLCLLKFEFPDPDYIVNYIVSIKFPLQR